MSELNNYLFGGRKYEKRYYWSLKEILLDGTEKDDYLINNSDFKSLLSSLVLHGYSTSLLDNAMAWTNSNYASVMDLVIRRHLDSLCLYSNNESYPSALAHNFIAKVAYILEMTSPRYLTLLKAYSDSQTELLDPVINKSKNLTRFNDTPQDEGDFAHDEHTTNITEVEGESSNELDTKMGRIKEIEEKYRNILLDWSNEFESLFIEEDNI